MSQIKLKGKGPIAIGILLEMPDNKLLFQLRDNKKEIHYPGTWSIFTGALEDSDWDGNLTSSLNKGILRELGEELKIFTQDGESSFVPGSEITLFDEFLYVDPTTGYADYQYVFHAKVNVPFDDLHLKEGKKLGVYGEKELDQLNLAPSYEGVIRKFFSSKKEKELVPLSKPEINP